MDPKIIRAISETIVDVVKKYLATFSTGIESRLKTIEERPQAKNGQDGSNGADGRDGRDAFELEILPTVDLSKSYPRGTYACYKSGIIRAFKNTEASEDRNSDISRLGWDVIVCGVSDIQISINDEGRGLTVQTELTNGQKSVKTMNIPTVLDRGVFNKDKSYEAGDGVTYSGSFWIAQEDTQDKPGEGKGWRLAVKRGRDGKDGMTGAQGPEGQKGQDGRDLTQMGLNGRKY